MRRWWRRSRRRPSSSRSAARCRRPCSRDQHAWGAAMSEKVLLLGGTAEARRLAEALTADGVDVVSSLAGRTAAPVLPPGEVRIGGFGGAEGLARWLRENPVRAVVDATHPFAAAITAHAAQAATATGTPVLRLQRPGWREQPGDDWRWGDSLDAAAEAGPRLAPRLPPPRPDGPGALPRPAPGGP